MKMQQNGMYVKIKLFILSSLRCVMEVSEKCAIIFKRVKTITKRGAI
jgi:hypothetical protein